MHDSDLKLRMVIKIISLNSKKASWEQVQKYEQMYPTKMVTNFIKFTIIAY